jgi:hypothetical protein
LTKVQNTRRDFLAGAAALFADLLAPSQLVAQSAVHAGRAPADAPPLRQSAERAASAAVEAPAAPIRGLMLDAARVPESLEYYKRVVDFCSEWSLNTIQFRLTDDQGTAMKFRSVPDLVTHRNAFTGDQLRRLVEYSQHRGIDLIPEIESFGHTGFLTRSPTYAYLLDTEDQGSSEFSGVIPVSDETHGIFDKLYREVASIFPSKYLHGGCDEVNWGGSAQSRAALRSKSRAQVWAEYLNSLDQIAKELGRQFIVWGDFVVHKEPAVLPMLSKDIVIMDWNYTEISSAALAKTLSRIGSNGSRAIGAPALHCWGWGARVGAEQLRNIEAFGQAYLESGDSASLGVILTNWIPSRYVQNSIWDGLAYAAVVYRDGSATAQTSGFRLFIEQHFAATWNEDWDQAFRLLYETAPHMRGRTAQNSSNTQLIVPWSNEAELANILKVAPLPVNPFITLRSVLDRLEPSVLKNLDDFRAMQLCAEYLEWAYWREYSVQELAASSELTPVACDTLIQAIAQRDRDLHGRLTADWDRGRPSDAEAKTQPVFDLQPKDELLYQWGRAAAFSAVMAANPERFRRLLQSKKE